MTRYKTSIFIEGASDECGDYAEIIEKGGSLVMVLADGSGGISGGAFAAGYLVNSAKEFVSKDINIFDPLEWMTFFVNLDMWLYGNKDAGETTALIVCQTRKLIQGVSVGDSEAWVFSDRENINLTKNQKIKPLLGSGGAVPSLFNANIRGTIVLGSDGLFKYTNTQTISRVIRDNSIKNAAKTLADQVRLKTGELQDDVSIILSEFI